MSDVVSVFQDLDTAYQKKTIKLLQSKHSQVYLALFRALFPDTSQGMVADKLWSRMDECLRDLEEAGCADLLPKEGGKTKRGRSVCHDLIDRYNWVESKRREDGQMEYRLTSDAVEALETVERLRATNTVMTGSRMHTILDQIDRAYVRLSPNYEEGLRILQQSQDQEKIQRDAARQAANRARTEWERLEGAGAAASAEQAELIDSYVAKAEEPFVSDDGVALLARRYGDGKIAESVTRSMRARTRIARDQATERTEQLEQVFGSYKEHWLDFDDPIGVGVDSYPDYLRILEELEQAQLDLHIDDWLVDTLRRAGASLAPLARAYTTDLREIRRRMDPINEIMGKFSFGPDAGQLEIVVAQRSPKYIRDFQRELAGWAGLATQAEFEDIDTLHLRLRAFMERLQEACERRATGPLNTKRLVYITVVAHYPNKPHVPDKAYSSLGAKSGGETQELIAFILGAALLFCLGDNGQALPAFAPVFLDEAFIKADERFTRRAITALTGLGFQVIIAVPTSKVQAVEPVATEYACVTKDPVSNHSFVTEMTAVRENA